MASLPEPGPRMLTTDQDLHFARRFTYGPQPSLLAEIKRHGRMAWFEKQLSPQYIHDPAPGLLLLSTPLAKSSAAQIRAQFPALSGSQYGEAMRQLRVATLARQLYSSRQLFERMVQLWQDRLIVSPGSIDISLVPPRDQLIRKHALGRFSDLIALTTRDPAMLQFLDASTSTGSNPNENLGRELLELHTVGSGHYTETDVHNSALVLTGLTVAPDGTATYKPGYHYVGPVKVMGWSHSNTASDDGNAVIASYLDYLAHHPATATHISTYIARRFVSDAPDPKLIKAMAATYTKSKTSITAVLRTMVGHKAFAASVAEKAQGPADGMLASIRTLRCLPVPAKGYPDPLTPLLYALQNVNAAPISWPTPDGPPDSSQAVSASTVLARWNLNQALVNGTFPGLKSPVTGLLGAVDKKAQAGGVVDRATGVLLNQKVTAKHRNQLLSFINRREHLPIDDLSRVPGLLAMILDGPYAAVR